MKYSVGDKVVVPYQNRWEYFEITAIDTKYKTYFGRVTRKNDVTDTGVFYVEEREISNIYGELPSLTYKGKKYKLVEIDD